MKYQTRYNTELTKGLLQVLLYLIDNHQITYEEFTELSSLSKPYFFKIMEMLEEMLEDLDLKATLSKDVIIIKDDNLIEHEAYIYYFRQIGKSYYFNLEQVDEEKRISYSLVITYLMLKNRQYVTLGTLSKILPDFDKKKMFNLINSLKEIIGEELYKNEIQSYVIEEE